MKIEQSSINIQTPCCIDGPIYDHTPHGWYARNSVIIQDCVPTYRNSGGGVTSDCLTDLPTALKECISNLDQRIGEAEKLKKQLAELLENN